MFRMAFREVLGNKRFSFFFALNLAIGLIGFVTLNAFKSSFQDSLKQSSKALLTADIRVSARRTLSSEEEQKVNALLGQNSQYHKSANLYSMIASQEKTRLVELRAISSTHPYYGQIKLERGGVITGDSSKDLFEDKKVWIYPELRDQLKVKIGDQLKIGTQNYEISDVVLDDAGVSWAGTSVAPRVYISLPELATTGLVQKGSTVWSSLLIKVAHTTDVKELVKMINKTIDDPGVRVMGHESASQQTGRLLNYLSDYLGLVAISALFLAGLGAAYLYRNYLGKRLYSTAVLISLGATPYEAIRASVIQLVLLGIIAAIISILASMTLLPLTAELVEGFTPVSVSLGITYHDYLIAVTMSIFGSLFICLPLMIRIIRLKASGLFQEHAMFTADFRPIDLLALIPAGLSYWGLAVWQANSMVVGTAFVAGFIGSAILLGMVCYLLLAVVQKVFRPRKLTSKLALLQISRNRVNAIASFLALSLGTLLINIVPQVKASLETEISQPKNSKLPSLFLFDIQDYQVEDLKENLNKRNAKIDLISPLIRARLVSINGNEFKKPEDWTGGSTREEQNERRFRNRGFNLSFRARLTPSEEIVSGTHFPVRFDPKKQELPYISVEVRFANRLNLKMGDILEFDVQGEKVKGKITNFRKVKWTSFQPNFFVQFQPGVLEDAPKTHVASISKVTNAQKRELQNSLVDLFPNVSIIDVSRVVTKIVEIIENMAWILNAMAALSLFAGFVVLFSIANHQVQSRKWDISLLKVLGSNFSTIRVSLLKEFAMISIAASLLGSLLALTMSWFMSFFIFEGSWQPDLKVMILSFIGVNILAILVTLLATNKTLKLKPILLLSSE